MSLRPIYTVADVLEPIKRALRLTQAGDISLAISRIDLHHRELCGLAGWPQLRREASTVPTAGVLSLSGALGVLATADSATAAPYWYCERFDVEASDLAERRLWSLAATQTAGNLDIGCWSWDTATGLHVAASAAVNVHYWVAPAALTAADGALSLPETRALLVRAILDLIGLMDRKDVSVEQWRAELESSMTGLMALVPAAGTHALRLPSGRILTRSPSR
jgi:hypothetical protein